MGDELRSTFEHLEGLAKLRADVLRAKTTLTRRIRVNTEKPYRVWSTRNSNSSWGWNYSSFKTAKAAIKKATLLRLKHGGLTIFIREWDDMAENWKDFVWTDEV